jgi:hypothetical protein
LSHYDETIFQIWRIIEKRCYYLRSAAGAGIGYSIATIQSDISMIESRVLLASLLSWAFSFFFGLAAISNLRLVVGFFSVTPRDFSESQAKGGEEHETFIQNIDYFSNELGRQSKRHYSMQVVFLSLGALLLVMTKIDIAMTLGLAT